MYNIFNKITIMASHTIYLKTELNKMVAGYFRGYLNNIIKYYEDKNFIDLKLKYTTPVSLYILYEKNSIYSINTWYLYEYKNAYKLDNQYNYILLDNAFDKLYLLNPYEPSSTDIYHGLSRLGGNHYIIKSIREYNGRNYELLQKTMSRQDNIDNINRFSNINGMDIELKLLLRKLDNNQKVEQIWKWTDTFSKKDSPAVLISEKIIDSGNGNTIKCASKY